MSSGLRMAGEESTLAIIVERAAPALLRAALLNRSGGGGAIWLSFLVNGSDRRRQRSRH
jgi:hypothetical protein